jgi:hypothetical protein
VLCPVRLDRIVLCTAAALLLPVATASAKGLWTTTGSLASARAEPTATLLDTTVRAGQAPSSPYPVPPGAVLDLKARALSTSRVGLTFSAPGVPPAQAYVIKLSRSRIAGAAEFERATALCGGVCRLTPRAPRERLALTVTRLRPKRTYYFALRARDSAGRLSPMSNVAVATTRHLRPGRVRNLRARAVSATGIRLTFSAPGAPPARRYIVKQSRRPITSARRFRRARRLCGASCRFRPRRKGQRLALLVTDLQPGKRYCYALRARSGGRVSARSNTDCARTRGKRR